jgi:chromosome segregation ATPase
MEKNKMQTRQINCLTVIPLLLFALSGCAAPQKQVDAASSPESIIWAQDSSVARRFKESPPQNRTAVESALELSEKYATLSEHTAELRRENKSLLAENSKLKEHVSALDTELQQTQKELTEANDLLIKMRVELNNWKTNVLGFRDEMRQAEEAELEALLKILKVLGGEVTAEFAQEEGTTSVKTSSRKVERTGTQEVIMAGEFDE